MSLSVDIQKRLGAFQLTVRFETGEGVLGLLGASGCGKSMTLKCIAGVERPDRGTIVLDGETLFDSERRIDLPPQKRRVGYLFQSLALFPNMMVRQNILCGLCRERDRTEREEELEKALRLCRLEGLENHRPHQFRPEGQENLFPVEYLGEMEGPFGWIQEFCFQGQRPGTPLLWRCMPKELWTESASELGVDPADVLLLYE